MCQQLPHVLKIFGIFPSKRRLCCWKGNKIFKQLFETIISKTLVDLVFIFNFNTIKDWLIMSIHWIYILSNRINPKK